MPEGPEVETVRRTLAPLVTGARLGVPTVSALPLRTPISNDDLAFLQGRRVIDVGRRGKTLWLRVEGDGSSEGDGAGDGVVVRLGMTGQLTVTSTATPVPIHTHVRVPLLDGNAHTTGTELRFRDPRRFGEVVPFRGAAGLAALCAGLGPDGLALTDDDRAIVAHGLRQTSRSIKEALLDQRLVAGVGNIYAAEACFLAGLAPTRKGTSLTRAEAARLVEGVEETLAQGVRHRGTSFSDYVDASGDVGDNARHVWVFQREGKPCRRCETTIARIVQGARSTFWCPRCQRRRRQT
jgi:formamidopyrimidine-DNA glycosylase